MGKRRCLTAAIGQVSVAASGTHYLCHLVAVAHPHLRLPGYAGQQFVVGQHTAIGAAVFSSRCTVNLAAEHLADQLHSVADSQHGQAQPQDVRIAARRRRLEYAGRTARKYQPARRQFKDTLGRNIVADDLAIDMLLAHPAGDQLRVLRTEIKHQHFFLLQHRHISLCPQCLTRPSAATKLCYWRDALRWRPLARRTRPRRSVALHITRKHARKTRACSGITD